MFTGIIEESGPVLSFDGSLLTCLFSHELLKGLKTGASVACDGVCLTVVGIDGDRVSFNVIEETLSKTTLSELRPQSKVNLERSLTMGSEVGGHLISGHVMGVGMIESIARNIYTIIPPPSLLKYLFPKGFIAIDGMSLTLVEVTHATFSIHLIPETLSRATIAHKKVGGHVNIEVDMQTMVVVETVERMLRGMKDEKWEK